MMRELLHAAVDGDLILTLRRRKDTIRYIVARWNEAHEQPIDRSELALFLCDERYGDLTEEQRSFAKQCKTEMREIYRGLIHIEHTFRITKSELDTRPIFVKTNEHIDAHFTVCFTALVLIRLLEKRLKEKLLRMP